MTQEDSRWKAKYSRLLDDYERLEEAFKRRSGLLERGLVRSSLAAEGQDQRLDQLLQSLRDSLRTADTQQLQQVVDDIERHLLATENQRSDRQRALHNALEDITEQLLKSSRDRASRQALKKLQKALGDSKQLGHQLHLWLDEISQLQGRILQQENPEEANNGLLGRLLGKKQSSAAAPVQAETDELDTPEETVQHSTNQADQAATPPAEHLPISCHQESGEPSDTSSLCSALIRLLDELAVSGPDVELAAQLQQQLAQKMDWPALNQIINQLAELIIRISTSRQQEFSNYLQQLNSRLNLITHSVSQTRDSYQNSIESADNLDQNLHSQVSELHQDVRQTSDLAELKQRVDQRLNQFVDTLNQHQQQRKETELRLIERLDDLGNRVHQVENEAAQLTSQLMEQHEKARRDALTGLPNRAAWDERLQIEYARLQRSAEPLLLAVIDVDHFKRINDTYGHLAGDKVLKILANRLQQGVRKTDFMARYGGEEFALLLPNTQLDHGIQLLNKLREQIAGCPFHFRGKPVQITFSAGIGQLRTTEESSATFARVDQALYAAKEAGRNQVKNAN